MIKPIDRAFVIRNLSFGVTFLRRWSKIYNLLQTTSKNNVWFFLNLLLSPLLSIFFFKYISLLLSLQYYLFFLTDYVFFFLL